MNAFRIKVYRTDGRREELWSEYTYDAASNELHSDREAGDSVPLTSSLHAFLDVEAMRSEGWLG